MGRYSEKARENFLSGYNCSQAVVLAFSELFEIDEKTLLMLSSPFGGGMGRLREVCGAVSGMLTVAGLLWGYSSPTDKSQKAECYAMVQKLVGKFRERNGSFICRTLVGKEPTSTPEPTDRTPEFYQKRPCANLVALAAAIIEEEMEERREKC